MNTLKHLLNASRRHPLTGEYTLTYDEISAVLQHIMKTGCTVLLGGDVLDVQMQQKIHCLIQCMIVISLNNS